MNDTHDQSVETAQGPLRCMLQQAAMPKFRLPFYKDLSGRPGIDLEVMYGKLALPNVDTGGLNATFREVKRLPGNLYFDAAHMRAIKRNDYDAISMAWNTRYLTLFPGIIRAKRRGIGVVLWGHGYSKNEGALRARLRLRAAEMADAICTYNHEARDSYIARGIPEEKAFVALNAQDQTPIQAAREDWLSRPDDLARFANEHGLDRGPVALFVSRLYEPNRVDMLIRAAKDLSGTHPGMRVVVIGKGPDEERLRRVAQETGMGERVIFTGAIYDERELAPWFLSSTLFCYPQNIGLSILHAMGYGLPVVTSDRVETQNPEITALDHGVNGLHYTHGDQSALAGALDAIVSDPALRARMSGAAHETATTRFTIENMADGMESALRYAADRARERRGG